MIDGMIAMAWADYRKKVVHPDAEDIQVKQTRKAFYAGGAAVLTSMMQAMGPGRDSEDSDVVILEKLLMELRDHLRAVNEGRD